VFLRLKQSLHCPHWNTRIPYYNNLIGPGLNTDSLRLEQYIGMYT